MVNVELRDYQLENAKNHLSILDTNVCVIDTSEMGDGKSILVIHDAQKRKCSLFVVCNTSMIPVWEDLGTEYGIPITTITYDKLRGTRGNFNHPWLELDSDSKVVPTNKLQRVIKKGCLFVFDESQAAKNKTKRNVACVAISTAIREAFDSKNGTRSRIAILSRTPTSGNNIEFLQLLRIAGIITQDTLVKRASGSYLSTGFEELRSYCDRLDPKTTRKVIFSADLNCKNAPEYTRDLYVHVIKKHLVTTMGRGGERTTVLNLFSSLDEEEKEALIEAKKAYSKAEHALNSGEKKGTVLKRFNILTHRHTVELVSVSVFAQLARRVLSANPNCKVILYFWTRAALHKVATLLEDYNPVVINGEVSSRTKRSELLAEFQAPNLDTRVLLTHPEVMGMGVDLGDNDGGFPRCSFMSPHFHYLPQHQARGRTDRATNFSPSTFVIVFLEGLEEEMHLFDRLSDKADGMRDVIKSQHELKFLPDYPVVYESKAGSDFSLPLQWGKRNSKPRRRRHCLLREENSSPHE